MFRGLIQKVWHRSDVVENILLIILIINATTVIRIVGSGAVLTWKLRIIYLFTVVGNCVCITECSQSISRYVNRWYMREEVLARIDVYVHCTCIIKLWKRTRRTYIVRPVVGGLACITTQMCTLMAAVTWRWPATTNYLIVAKCEEY